MEPSTIRGLTNYLNSFLNCLNDRTFVHSKPKPQQLKFGLKEPNREILHIYESQTTSTQLETQITSITELLSIINLNNPVSNLKNSKVTYDIHPRPKPYTFNFSNKLSIIRTFMDHVWKPPHVNLCFTLLE